jgi:phosphomannomutase
LGFFVGTKRQESRIPLKRLIVFDLDGTLAESKSPVDREVLTLLHELLGIVKVAVISGGDWPSI